MLSSPQKQRAVSLSSIAEPHGVYGADCIAVQKQIKHYQLLQATLSVLYDQSGAAQRSWSRNSKFVAYAGLVNWTNIQFSQISSQGMCRFRDRIPF